MAVIGNLGKLITFEVSAEYVLTIQKMTQTVKSRWANHAVIGGKPQLEFLGPDIREISFSVLLSASHGIRPRTTMERIERAIENGENNPFILGGRSVGIHNWVITNMSESWDIIIQDGKLVQGKVTLTLQEYV